MSRESGAVSRARCGPQSSRYPSARPLRITPPTRAPASSTTTAAPLAASSRPIASPEMPPLTITSIGRRPRLVQPPHRWKRPDRLAQPLGLALRGAAVGERGAAGAREPALHRVVERPAQLEMALVLGARVDAVGE